MPPDLPVNTKDAVADLPDPEKRAYNLLFEQRLTCAEASRILKAEGINWSEIKLRTFKKKAFELLVKTERDEHFSELVLDSFERTKVEFEDLLDKLKAASERFNSTNQPFEEVMVLREIKDVIGMALKVQGKYNDGLQSIHAKTINIISSPEFLNSFKQFQSRQFEQMGAVLEDNKIVFTNPSAEFMDDFLRWRDAAKPNLAYVVKAQMEPVDEVLAKIPPGQDIDVAFKEVEEEKRREELDRKSGPGTTGPRGSPDWVPESKPVDAEPAKDN